eukprot:1796799-Ditylum_brightwellii.AAC.1
MATILCRGGADAKDKEDEEKEVNNDKNIVSNNNKGAGGKEKKEKKTDHLQQKMTAKEINIMTVVFNM